MAVTNRLKTILVRVESTDEALDLLDQCDGVVGSVATRGAGLGGAAAGLGRGGLGGGFGSSASTALEATSAGPVTSL